MSSAIDQAYWRMRCILPDEYVEAFDAFYKGIDTSKLSIRARLPLRDFDLNRADHSEWEYGTDYEVGCCYRNPETDEELGTYDEVDSAIEDLQEREEGLENEVGEVEDEITGLEIDLDEAEDNGEDTEAMRDSIADLVAKKDTLEAELNGVREEIQGWEKSKDEPEYDEILWNMVWRPEGELDATLARSLGFGILTITNNDRNDYGDDYMGLTCCGQDMTPALMAYCALKYRAVDREWTGYFDREPDWTKYVIGEARFREVCEAVDIPYEEIQALMRKKA